MLIKCHKCNMIHFVDNIALSIIWDTGKIRCECGNIIPFKPKKEVKKND